MKDKSRSFEANPLMPVSDQPDNYLIVEQLTGFDSYRRSQAPDLMPMPEDEGSALNNPRLRYRLKGRS
jgi:hypothetical protein